MLSGFLSMPADATLPATTNLRIEHGNSLDLNGHTLDHGGDLYVRISNVGNDGLRIVHADSVMHVGGDAEFDSYREEGGATSEGNFSAGEIHFRGDFQQSSDYKGSLRAFVSTGTRAVFDGTSLQTISFANESSDSSSRFHDIEVGNPVGVLFEDPTLATGDLDVSGVFTTTSELTLEGTMILRSTATLNNNGIMSVGGCLTEPGHVLNGADPCP